VRATISSAPSPFWTVITVAPAKCPASRARAARGRALARDDHELGSGSSPGSVAAVDARREVGAAR
jgi:hypothetical protein